MNIVLNGTGKKVKTKLKDKIKVKTLEELADRKGNIKHSEVINSSGRKLKQIEHFIKLERKDKLSLFLAQEATPLFLYLLDSINRKKETAWCNLDSYYNKGLLVTTKTQKHVSDEVGVCYQTIGNWLEKLEKIKFIKAVGSEKMKIGNSWQDVTIWALGELVLNRYGEKEEVYYYEQQHIESTT